MIILCNTLVLTGYTYCCNSLQNQCRTKRIQNIFKFSLCKLIFVVFVLTMPAIQKALFSITVKSQVIFQPTEVLNLLLGTKLSFSFRRESWKSFHCDKIHILIKCSVLCIFSHLKCKEYISTLHLKDTFVAFNISFLLSCYSIEV